MPRWNSSCVLLDVTYYFTGKNAKRNLAGMYQPWCKIHIRDEPYNCGEHFICPSYRPYKDLIEF